MRAVLGSLGVRDVTYLPGVDGSMLLEKRSGRACLVQQKNQKWKLTWTDAATGLRKSQMQRMPPKKNARRGWNLWGMLGCNFSHMAVWEHMQKHNVEVATFWEDDCHLVADPADALCQHGCYQCPIPRMDNGARWRLSALTEILRVLNVVAFRG